MSGTTPIGITIENPWTLSLDKSCSTIAGSSWADLWLPRASIACDDFVFSFDLGDLSCVAVQHPCDEDVGELVKAQVVVQQGLELFSWTKLRAKGECCPGLC